MNGRRDAIKAMGGALLGGVGLAASQGNTSRPYINARDVAQKIQAAAHPSDLNGYAEKQIDPLWEARCKAVEPLQNQIDELRGWSRNRLHEYTQPAAYLEALKSPSQWWKIQVILERAKKARTIEQELQSQISKILRDPLESLSNESRGIISNFLAELAKP